MRWNSTFLLELRAALGQAWQPTWCGRLRSVQGTIMTCRLPAAVGDLCWIYPSHGPRVAAQVIGFRDATAILAPFEPVSALGPGTLAQHTGKKVTVPFGPSLLGRVLDGLGRPVDGKPPPTGRNIPVRATARVSPLTRTRIRQPFITGQRVIDGLLTLGQGQRVGIFAGSGVGKSTLLGEIARGAEAEVVVLALIGERGREVRSFLEDHLGTGLARSVVVVATSDEMPLMRLHACWLACTIAEEFRQSGKQVLLLLDSLTRLAMAQRELGLALGEPPSSRGYTPSVFQLLASTLERLGPAESGSITALMTILVEGDDLDEPIADACRALLDGHIVLERQLAEKGHYPAVNVLRSVSRIAHEVVDANHARAAQQVRSLLATLAEVEDLVRIGAYVRGSQPQIDRALDLQPALLQFLRQNRGERISFSDTRAALERLAAAWATSAA
ncbi:MAG: FliI/YscN family ATPase [Gemmatales bacterium]|nr:FliI/YscN family ATPase [Gemmatales bacterium]MDW7995824.1 FliI/YscN family ATPase [Gemmatales bacterium]